MNEDKFKGMGDIYSRYRPSYPLEFIKHLKTNVGLSCEKIVADIGSGTGILTNQLLTEGNVIYAVEPNYDMRKVAESNLQKYEGFISINGTAENTGLKSKSVDYVTVAQAFHWFDSQNFKKECQRILKPNGKVILVWNGRDDKSDLVVENDIINRKYCPNFKGFTGGMRGTENEDNFNNFFNGNYEIKVFNNDLTFDQQAFIGRNLSASYALKVNDDNYSLYISELKELFDKYSENGIAVMGNFTRSYIGCCDVMCLAE